MGKGGCVVHRLCAIPWLTSTGAPCRWGGAESPSCAAKRQPYLLPLARLVASLTAAGLAYRGGGRSPSTEAVTDYEERALPDGVAPCADPDQRVGCCSTQSQAMARCSVTSTTRVSRRSGSTSDGCRRLPGVLQGERRGLAGTQRDPRDGRPLPDVPPVLAGERQPICTADGL
jgi:hypothetical protein